MADEGAQKDKSRCAWSKVGQIGGGYSCNTPSPTERLTQAQSCAASGSAKRFRGSSRPPLLRLRQCAASSLAFRPTGCKITLSVASCWSRAQACHHSAPCFLGCSWRRYRPCLSPKAGFIAELTPFCRISQPTFIIRDRRCAA